VRKKSSTHAVMTWSFGEGGEVSVKKESEKQCDADITGLLVKFASKREEKVAEEHKTSVNPKRKRLQEGGKRDHPQGVIVKARKTKPKAPITALSLGRSVRE